MVNKQYNVQSVLRKSPNGEGDGGGGSSSGSLSSVKPVVATTSTSSSSAIRSNHNNTNNNVTVISRIPNPQQKYNVTNLNGLSTDVLKSSHSQEIQPGVFGRNITLYRDEDYGIASAVADIDVDDHDSNHSNMKEMSISDIGRFQYILQMDREMVSRSRAFHMYIFTKQCIQNNRNKHSCNNNNNKTFITNTIINVKYVCTTVCTPCTRNSQEIQLKYVSKRFIITTIIENLFC